MKLLTALITLMLTATYASAWEKQESTDAFSGKDQSFYYSNGKVIQTIGDTIVGTPTLHYYPDIPINYQKWALIPGDNFICSSVYGINAQMKIDGKIVKGEVKPIKSFIFTAMSGFKFDYIPINPSPSAKGLLPYAKKSHQFLIHNELTWLAEAIYKANKVVIKYIDGCGNGGVFEFNLNKKE